MLVWIRVTLLICFESIFVCGSIQLTKVVDLLGLIFQNYVNTCKSKFQQQLMNNTSKLFIFNVCESFMYFLVLE
jgi:hypothetical protein